MGTGLGGLLSLLLALPPGGEPPAAPVVVRIQAGRPAEPAVSILLLGRRGGAAVDRVGTTHTGGGTIDVAQPAPDTVVVTMTGVAVATDHPCGDSTAAIRFELEQCFEVIFDDPELEAAKLTVEARVVGLLRSGPKGAAAAAGGGVAVGRGGEILVSLSAPDRGVAGGESLAVHDRSDAVTVPVRPGGYVLNQTWELAATHAKALLGRAASAEFAPDPALDPIWISRREPFHGAVKKDFGFQVTIRVAEDR
jgi:hypothetical protein